MVRKTTMENPAEKLAIDRGGFVFVAGSLWLDFVNTRFIGPHGPVDRLVDFAALAKWCMESGAFERGPLANALKQMAAIVDARHVLAHAIEFRAMLHEIAARLDAGKTVPQRSLDALNRELLYRAGYNEVVRAGGGYRKRFLMQIDTPMSLFAPIAMSAADLLTSGEPQNVRKCANPGCVLFFYDTTKNHRRRWCSMKVCGNRTKAAAHYARMQSARG
jgi:predicted RNA-binding Zn ribbon-like protein